MKNLRTLLNYVRNYGRSLWKFRNKKLIFEFHATEHCNLACRSCSHFSPLAKPEFCNVSSLEKSLKRLHYFQDICELVNILGGEPLLNPQISELMALARKYMDRCEIHLVTNGILLLQPQKLPKEFWSTCRDNNITIRVSRYPIRLDYDEIQKTCETNGVKILFVEEQGLSEGGWKKWLLNERGKGCIEYRLKYLKLMKCRKRCVQIVNGRLYACTRTAYIRHLNEKFNTSFKVKRADYLEIDKIKNERQIRKLVMYATPFCKYCPEALISGNWGPTKYAKEEWLDTDNTERRP